MNLEIGLIISQVLAFLILLWIMKKFAWKPFLKILETRRKKMEEGFADIENQRKNLDGLIHQYTHQLEAIEETAQKKMAELVAEGQKTAQRIQEEAQNQARATLEKVKVEMAREVEQAQKELKEKIIDMVIDATEKLLKEKIDRKKEQDRVVQLIEEARLNGHR